MAARPHIVLVMARGEAVRNFAYSGVLRLLSENARVTLLSVVTDEEVMGRFAPLVERIVPLGEYRERALVTSLRYLLHTAHFRWLWSEAAKYHWALHDAKARTPAAKTRRALLKVLAHPLANRPMLETMTQLDEALSWVLRPTDDFVRLFDALKPDLVFNCSHIHGPLADLPLRTAHRLGIPTAAFIFSWDNLTSRSRIFVPYDYYLVWNQQMRDQLLGLYPAIGHDRVFVTGTPQFDFHFQPQFRLTREKLCSRIGLDPRRPFVLYSTGLDSDFLEEHRIVEEVIRTLREGGFEPRPQLVVRTYIKGTSPEMQALAERHEPDVIFPPILWQKAWLTPLYEDLYVYTNLLRHAALGINAASTVTLELMMHQKPVINLGFEPPGSYLPWAFRFSRHVEYEHYRPVAHSGAVMLARSPDDLGAMIARGLREPGADAAARVQFLETMFHGTLDGRSARRVADVLHALATVTRASSPTRSTPRRIGGD